MIWSPTAIADMVVTSQMRDDQTFPAMSVLVKFLIPETKSSMLVNGPLRRSEAGHWAQEMMLGMETHGVLNDTENGNIGFRMVHLDTLIWNQN